MRSMEYGGRVPRWNGKNERGIKEGGLKGERDHVLMVQRHPTRREWGGGRSGWMGYDGGTDLRDSLGETWCSQRREELDRRSTEWRGVTGSSYGHLSPGGVVLRSAHLWDRQ